MAARVPDAFLESSLAEAMKHFDRAQIHLDLAGYEVDALDGRQHHFRSLGAASRNLELGIETLEKVAQILRINRNDDNEAA